MMTVFFIFIILFLGSLNLQIYLATSRRSAVTVADFDVHEALLLLATPSRLCHFVIWLLLFKI